MCSSVQPIRQPSGRLEMVGSVTSGGAITSRIAASFSVCSARRGSVQSGRYTACFTRSAWNPP